MQLRMLFLAGCALLGLPAVAQNQQGGQPQDFYFELFSIRPENIASGVPMNTAPSLNGFNSQLSLRQAILIAYGPDSNSANWSSIEILKTPAWIDDFYDIRARVSDTDLKTWQSQSSDHELLHSALRAALKERCNLAIHEQPSKAATFDLVIAKHGPRLKATAPEAAFPGGKKLPSGGVMLSIAIKSVPAKAFYGATLQDLVDFLSTVSTKIPVRDKTNLLGRYDFTLLQIPTAPNEDRVFNYPVDRLGLQIKLGTENRSMLVIDHIEKPTPN